MKFWKMNGAGNDFLVLNNLELRLPEDRFPALARTLCERHLSIGADGFMVVDASDCGADYRMLFYNSDGSVGEMCGNGARCICRYGYENGLAGQIQRVQTTAGLVTGERISARQYRVRLQNPEDMQPDCPLALDGAVYPCFYAVVGVPHAVVPIEHLADFDRDQLRRLGRALRFHPAFPRGANVDFIEVTGEHDVLALTYERGVEDFTYACGTGAGSIALALTVQGRMDGNAIQIHMPGGVLTVDVARGADGGVTDLFLTGPTTIVCKGEITEEALVQA